MTFLERFLDGMHTFVEGDFYDRGGAGLVVVVFVPPVVLALLAATGVIGWYGYVALALPVLLVAWSVADGIIPAEDLALLLGVVTPWILITVVAFVEWRWNVIMVWWRWLIAQFVQ